MSQTSIYHRKVFLQQKPVTERTFCDIRQKSFPFRKITHFHGKYNKNQHKIMEENYFMMLLKSHTAQHNYADYATDDPDKVQSKISWGKC